MNKILILFILFLFVPFLLGAQEDEGGKRGVQVLAEDLGTNVVVGKQYLFLIGIDKYEYWFPLKNPVQDAQELRDILLSRYYVDQVIELYDKKATKENIIKTFKDLQEKLTIDDSLLIYYAGHGHLDETTNTGFWIPVNGGTDVYKQENWLPNTQIRGIVTNIKATHICLISDSCFSGDILNTSRALAPEINNEYFKKAYARTSRQVITSGASETVPDASEFSQQLKMALLKNKGQFIDPLMLYNQIRLGVETTTPLFGNMKGTGHQEGASFILFLKEGREPELSYGNLNLSITSGGRLFIDNEFHSDVSPGNLILPKIEVGDHIIHIIYDQGDEESYTITVEADSTMTVTFSWKEKITKPEPEIVEEKKSEKTSYLSASLGFGLFMPMGESTDLLMMAPFPLVRVMYNLKLGWGILGFGVMSGVNLGSTLDDIPYPYKMTSIPASAVICYTTQFKSPFFILADISGGLMNNLVMYEDTSRSGYNTALFLTGGFGAGYRIIPNLAITAAGNFNAIVFKEALLMGVTPALQLELSF